MTQKIRILVLSANPWSTSRILVDEEKREISEKIDEGPYRDRFELHNHPATRPIDLQRLMLKYQPHIVHFAGHGSKQEEIILGGKGRKGKRIDQRGLAEVFALYNKHLRLVLLNACFTTEQARSLSEVVNYAIGAREQIGDKVGVMFAGAFYRALGFGKSVREAYRSANAELALLKAPRARGIELFVRNGIDKKDSFPRVEKIRNLPQRVVNQSPVLKTETRFEYQITVFKTVQQTVFA